MHIELYHNEYSGNIVPVETAPKLHPLLWFVNMERGLAE
jgi:hypothetical protein